MSFSTLANKIALLETYIYYWLLVPQRNKIKIKMADYPCCKLARDVLQLSSGEQKSFLSPVIDMVNGEILSYKNALTEYGIHQRI